MIALGDWRRLMTYGWLADKPDLGAVVEDGGRIVGFLGVIYADRQGQSGAFRTGNLTSWYLERPYRQGGLAMDLLRIATRRPDVAYTSFTSTAKAVPLLRLGGLRPLDGERRIWRRKGGPSSAVELVRNHEAVARELDRGERRLLDDHSGLAVHPCLARTREGDCLIVLSIHEKQGGLAHHEVLHLGAPEVFAANAQGVADALLPAGQARLSVDRRFLGDAPVGGEAEEIRVPRYYRPIPGLAPRDVDFLYSEVALLNLTLW